MARVQLQLARCGRLLPGWRVQFSYAVWLLWLWLSHACHKRFVVSILGQIVICIVTYRNIEDVLACLASLSHQTYQDFELVICENGGPEALTALCDALPGHSLAKPLVTIVSDHTNPGYAGGINRCIAARPGRAAYWVLNPDTVPQPQTLAAMAALLAGGTADAVGGPIVLPSGRLQTCGGKWNPWIAYSSAIAKGVPLADCPDSETVERSLSFISGASMLVSRRFIEVAGLMREDYFLYGEEVEWCLRAAALGLRLRFCKEAVVVHHQGSTTGSAGHIGQQGRLPIFCDERNRVLTLRDTAPTPRYLVAVVGAVLLILWRYGRRFAVRAMMHALAGWFAGLRNRRGKPTWLSTATNMD